MKDNNSQSPTSTPKNDIFQKPRPVLKSYTAPKEVLEEITLGDHTDPLFDPKEKPISEKESLNRKRYREPSPARKDPLISNIESNNSSREQNDRTYKDIMLEQKAKAEQMELLRRQQREEFKRMKDTINMTSQMNDNYHSNININENDNQTTMTKETKLTSSNVSNNKKISDWDKIEESEQKNINSNIPAYMAPTPRRRRWDLDATPIVTNPVTAIPLNPYLQATPTPSQMNKKWDETPVMTNTNMFGATPTPGMNFVMPTPTPQVGNSTMMKDLNNNNSNNINIGFDVRAITLENLESLKYDKDIIDRNKPLTDEDINNMLPDESEGYEIVPVPESYQQFLDNYYAQKKNQSTEENTRSHYSIPSEDTKIDSSAFSGLKPDDMKFFNTILTQVDESKLSPEELKERNIMTLLLKVKNGAPPMRKSALRQITEKAREFGAGPLFNQIIPLMMSPSLEDQERHLLVKVIDRILFKLDDLVRPYVHKILVAVMPMLRDENSYARIEGREIISNLAKSAGLATMISTMRPDIDNPDESIRSVTSKAFAVVASALGLPSILPFLKAVCQSKKSWLARDTGIKIVQQIAILIGCAVLPYLKNLVEIIEGGLKDEQQKIRTFTALALAALAEASYPYGIDAFGGVVRYLFDGIKQYKGKTLSAFFKAIGFIIPLMDSDLAARSTKLVVPVLKRDFTNPDENAKKIVLKVLKQCISTEGSDAEYIRKEIEEDFFICFWNRRMALDRKNYKAVVETTVEIAKKVTGSEVMNKIVLYLKDENELFRKMTLETIDNVISILGVIDVDKKLEALLIEGLLFCFQEQSTDDSSNSNSTSSVFLNCFSTLVSNLGLRIKPYISQICSLVQWRFNNKNSKIRQQSAELIVKLAKSLQITGEETLMSKLSIVLNENLGEEYPEVLGSILAALKAIVNVIGLNKMTPPIKDLLPKLTPILKNRNEKVQENVIDLIGLIANKGASYVSAKEWMRICFDLLDLLKAHRKNIRRATVNTFGYIAKAIGPQEVLVTLLNNLKVQERQNRVCTTVAIAIVSETCGPFTVIPALMNEYRVPELNVQNGVLKSFAFLFEYIGEMARDYIYAVVPILQDALTERDLVHRQIAASAIKHLAIGVCGLNCEDALVDLLNYVWPNIFETSPHVVMAVTDAIEGLRVGLGVNRLMSYILQGLFHPARRIRDVYWRIYNLMYVGAQDDLCACYPTLPSESKNNEEEDRHKYEMGELNLFI